MPVLQLRPEFQNQHMRATAIELSNRQNTGWTQRKGAAELLDITYPTGDVRRALDAVSATAAGKPIVMIGRPEEIAEAVVWLCSDAASFVTGIAMPVDGGLVAQ